ncbi:hypothetical protein N7535_002046 [Penicillium sp. DV-2018c]|nr:hypothetical protein N7461_004710 [Penicillium sp. DV-2018c]KAJ5583426.1 hypothetical protein N7535_002046 [Penicillium sp. DV-2018c]
MAASLLNLPSELRVEIFKYLLVQNAPIDPVGGCHGLEPNLLRTNKLFLEESRRLLYGYNRFHFGPGLSELLLPGFLANIGAANASHIRNITIDFPTIRKCEDDIFLDSTCLEVLEIIQTKCTNLQTLVTAAQTTNYFEDMLASFNSPQLCDKALGLVAARFKAMSKAIPSLQKIVVEIYEEAPSLDIRSKMGNHGWILDVVEVEPEIKVEMPDYDDDGYHYADDYGYYTG